MERIAKRALGTRAVLVRALRRPVAPVRPAQGIAAASTDEVLTLAPLSSHCVKLEKPRTRHTSSSMLTCQTTADLSSAC